MSVEELRPAVTVAVGIACAIAALGLVQVMGRFSPVGTWLCWKLATLWLWMLVFVAGCLALGTLVCRRALRDVGDLVGLERWLLVLASGAVAFALLLYLAGAMRLLHPLFAVAMPAVAVAAALTWAGPQLLAPLRNLRAARWTFTPLQVIVTAAGVIGLALVYVHVLNPDAMNHDAHWTHVVIAQDYAREGRLVPIYAGWTKNYPHLASVFYTWCFLVPGLADPERLLLVMHMEFVFFLGTLLGVSAVTRWLVSDARIGGRTAWAAFFLFPSIFVYDSNLGGSADHVCAFFMLPLLVAVLRGTETFAVGPCALAGAFAGAALITKYQSAYVTAGLGLLTLVRVGRAAASHLSRRPGPGPSLRQALHGAGALAGAAVLAASPYFLANLIFYRNPVFPFMQSVFTHSTPTFPDAAWLVSNVATPSQVRAVPQWGPRLRNGLETVFTFSFNPHYGFTNGVPYFGFLFTLLAPLSLGLPGGARLRRAALIGAGAVLAWGMTYLVDRNLQIVLPILVAVTAAVIAKLWRLGSVARAGLLPLVALQVVWGADFAVESGLPGALAHIRSGAAGQVNVRETLHRRAMTRALPKGATVLLHSEHVSLGLDRTVLADLSESQGLIDYHRLRTPREAYDRFRAVGVTHLTWIAGSPMNTPVKQADIIFLALVKSLPAMTFGPYTLVEMPALPPPARAPYRVLTVGLDGYRDGVYPIEELSKCEMRPPEVCSPPRPAVVVTEAVPADIVGAADVVLIGPGGALEAAADGALRSRFELAKATAAYRLYLAR